MSKLLTIFLFLLCSFQLFGQKPFRENIETDSSNIEIIRNSVYRIYEETYKFNDSIWYNVTYIDDTTKLHTEGWKLKNGKHLGIWKEFNKKGDLMYTHDYEKNTCEVNPAQFPYHDILEAMKLKADSLIIDAYGKDFMDNFITFEFDCYAYHRYKTKYSWSEDSVWTSDYLGNWTEPLKSKPNSFKFRYQVRLNKDDEKGIELGMDLDSVGNYSPSEDDFWNNYGFEKVEQKNKKFKVNKNIAIKNAKKYGLEETDTNKIDEFLYWENFKKQQYFNGQFRYYITEPTDTIEYKKSEERQGIIYKFNVYVFNPWTGEFIEKKKMKSIREWGKLSGHSTGLLPDND